MVSTNRRGWEFLDSNETPDLDTPKGQALKAHLDALMNSWSDIHHEMESEAWSIQSAREDPGYDAYEYDPRNCECDEGREDDPDELCSHDRASLTQYEEAERLRIASRALRQRLIESELASLGARPMRPYEHWNEDEAYMAWSERDRDY